MGLFLAIIRTKISVRLEVGPWFTGNTRVQVPARNGMRKAMIWVSTCEHLDNVLIDCEPG